MHRKRRCRSKLFTAPSLKPTDVLVRMINDGFAALKQGKTIPSAIALD
jgi:hypothetical protein